MKKSVLGRVPLVGLLILRPRLASSIAIGGLVYFVVPMICSMNPIGRLLVGYNVGAIMYLMLAGLMMHRSNLVNMKQRALNLDEGKFAMLLVVVIASLASLTAIAVQLSMAKELHGSEKIGH